MSRYSILRQYIIGCTCLFSFFLALLAFGVVYGQTPAQGQNKSNSGTAQNYTADGLKKLLDRYIVEAKANLQDLQNGVKEANADSHGKTLARLLQALVEKTKQQLVLLESLRKDLNNPATTEEQIDKKFKQLSDNLDSIRSSYIPSVIVEMENVSNTPGITVFANDKYQLLLAKIAKMKTAQRQLASRSNDLAALIAGHLLLPPPTIDQRIDSEIARYKELLERAKEMQKKENSG